MSKFLSVISMAILAAVTSGCATTSNGPSTSNTFEFTAQPNATFALANSKPLVFPQDADSSEKARHVFGYPLVQDQPIGKFDALVMLDSMPVVVEQYLQAGKSQSSQSGFGRDDGIAFGASVGGGAGAAIAAASMLSRSAVDSDVRQLFSAGICFIPLDKATSPQAAVDQCGLTLVENFKEALNDTIVENLERGIVVTGSTVAGDASKKTMLAAYKDGAYYAQGFAPADLGGYPAHIAFVLVENRPVNATTGPVLEDVLAGVVKAKPSNVAYMFSAMHDGRKRKMLAPLGAF
ncbi:hypothetical protein ACRCPS_17915 [Pseudomonas aeruginosa]